MERLIDRSRWRERWPLYLLSLMILATAFIAFPTSFLFRSNVVMGLLLFPFVIRPMGEKRINYFYFFAVTFFGFAAWYFHVRMFLFFMMAFSFLFIYEWLISRTDFLVLFLLIFMSPFFSQVSTILGFGFKIQLSEWAAMLLASAGMNIGVEGNTMILDGELFTVDEACAGLQMLATSLIIGVFLVTYHCYLLKLRLRFFSLIMFFLCVLLMNVLANQVRIIMLVLFRIPPEHPMHEGIGILIMMAYVLFPLYFFTRWLMARYGIHYDPRPASGQRPGWCIAAIALLAISIAAVGVKVNMQQAHYKTTVTQVEFQGGPAGELGHDVWKFVDDDLLVYVKPIPEFFSGEHTPVLCWKGSGYRFDKVHETVVEGRRIYVGELRKNSDTLYTAWWYSNGEDETTSQWEWRWKMLSNRDTFALINFTSGSRATLIKKVTDELNGNLIRLK